jgi:DNA polymerase-3 subunit delta'
LWREAAGWPPSYTLRMTAGRAPRSRAEAAGVGRPPRSGRAAPRSAPNPPRDWPGLAGVVGNPEAVLRLRTALESGHLAHALLLTGPEGVGKTSLCLALAGELLHRDGWPGGLTTHPDLWLEDSEEEAIKIDRVRAGKEPGSLQEFLALRPYAGGLRVGIIARADRLTEQAANSLLKTVEEPPEGSHLLVTVRSPEALPATIVSRCQRLSLAPVPSSAIQSWLHTAHAVPEPVAAEAAALAAGRPGRALRLATEPAALAAELAVLDRFLAVAGQGVAGALDGAAELAPPGGAEGRERLLVDLAVWASWARDAAAGAAGAPELAGWRSREAALAAWAAQLSPARCSEILDAILAATAAVVANAQPRLLLEVLFLGIFTGTEVPPPPPPST